MLDTGRNYLDIPSFKELIDVMAAYKLNLFHWHITEYYGWSPRSNRRSSVADTTIRSATGTAANPIHRRSSVRSWSMLSRAA